MPSQCTESGRWPKGHTPLPRRVPLLPEQQRGLPRLAAPARWHRRGRTHATWWTAVGLQDHATPTWPSTPPESAPRPTRRSHALPKMARQTGTQPAQGLPSSGSPVVVCLLQPKRPTTTPRPWPSFHRLLRPAVASTPRSGCVAAPICHRNMHLYVGLRHTQGRSRPTNKSCGCPDLYCMLPPVAPRPHQHTARPCFCADRRSGAASEAISTRGPRRPGNRTSC